MRIRIDLITSSDVKKFVNIVSQIEEEVTLIDSVKHCVSGKSLLGVMYSLEWDEVYCVCPKDISGLLLPWIVE